MINSTSLIQEAAFLKQMGRPETALETLREAVAQLEVERNEKHQLRPRLNIRLVKRRTRFFIKYAKRHEIRLSALLYVVAVHTRRTWLRGYRGQKAGWHQNAEWFGKQIGVNKRQIFRLLEKSKSLYLLDFKRTARGMVVWVVEPAIYKELKKGQTGWGDDHEYVVGYYYLRLAGLLGINGSVLYGFLREPEIGDDGEFLRYREMRAEDFPFYLPWMTEGAARKELERLEHFGVLRRKQKGASFSYFWHRREREDRAKWLKALLNERM